MIQDLTSKGAKDIDPQRNILLRLIIRMSVYYLIVGLVGTALLYVFPQLHSIMPVGGLAEFGQDPFTDIENGQMISSGKSAESEWFSGAISLLMAMTLTLIAMVPVSWVYKAIHEGDDFDHSIDETALIMPSVVAGVVTVAQNSLALAFSLAGIVAAVRFRRSLSDTFDTLFIFVAIGVGLAAGVAAIEIAVVITMFFNYATTMICIFGDGLESKYIAEKEFRRQQRKTLGAKSKKKQK